MGSICEQPFRAAKLRFKVQVPCSVFVYSCSLSGCVMFDVHVYVLALWMLKVLTCVNCVKCIPRLSETVECALKMSYLIYIAL